MLYQDINKLLAEMGSEATTAEAHGMAAGMMCVNAHAEPELWLEELSYGTDGMADASKVVMKGLFENTRHVLGNEDFSFDLLLPDEDLPLGERLQALREWSQGFLYGIGSATSVADWSKDCMEIVKDVTEFTKLETDAEGEAAESDFMELTEYLRTSVIFLFGELNAAHKNMLH